MMTSLPSDQSLEGVVLGIAMTSPEVILDIVSEVEGVDFHDQSHQLVYGTIRRLVERGVVADSAAVVAELKATGEIERLGGRLGNAVPYIRSLAESSPEPSNFTEYVAQLKGLSLRRAIITKATEALRAAADMSRCAEDLVDRVSVDFADLAVHRREVGPLGMRELAMFEFKDLERRRESHGPSGISTGYPDVDAITGGLDKQTLTLVAGRPGMGKSAWGGSIAVNVARAGIPVLIFSLEMSGTVMFRRMVASEGRVSSKGLRSGQLVASEYAKVARAMSELSDMPIFIDQDSGLSEVDIRARARRHKARHGLGLVLVDHVQLVRSDRREKTRDIEVGNVSWGLKRMAKELDIPVVALCQLSRAVESRSASNKKPTLSDLRDSGNLEQNADVVIGLYREGYYDPNSPRATEMDIGIIKNREGETGETVLRWNAKSVRFDSIYRGERAA